MQPTINNSPISAAAPSPIQSPITPPNLSPIQNAPHSNKMVVWMVVILVLIVLAAGGAYLYLNNNKVPEPAATPAPTIAPTPKPDTQDSLEKDLNSVDAEASASGIDSVDSDIKGL